MSALARYRIDGELGRGAMGVVYDAWDTTLDRRIALKELSFPGGMSSDVQAEMIERFGREARAAAKLSHPNVVQVYDVFAEDGRYFIAMEYLDGASLADYVDEGAMPPQAAVHILVQILDAVQAAHAAGIVHRDIKPDNIFVLPDGRVKVTDFGVAKLMDASSPATMTQIGTVMGTPGYMAPEQVMGVPVDGRADIFSAGVVGYELLSGVSPFMAPSTTATLFRIANEEPAPLTAYGVAPATDAVIRRALAKAPDFRYQTAAEMADDLRRGAMPGTVAATGAPTLIAGPSASVGIGQGGRSTQLIVGGVIVGALAIAAIVFFGPLGSSGGVGRTGASGGATASTTSQQSVPDVGGMSRTDAESALRGKGFVPKLTTEASELPVDTVVSQDPAAGTSASAGAIVTLAIAAPKPPQPPVSSANVPGVIAGAYTPGWTVVYNSMPSKSAALAAYASIKGSEPEAGVIDLSYFTRENGVPMTAGYYAVIYGHFASKAEATAATARYPKSADRYARYTQPK